jgi:hypothetical protein
VIYMLDPAILSDVGVEIYPLGSGDVSQSRKFCKVAAYERRVSVDLVCRIPVSNCMRSRHVSIRPPIEIEPPR